MVQCSRVLLSTALSVVSIAYFFVFLPVQLPAVFPNGEQVILGAASSNSINVWLRSDRFSAARVRYSTSDSSSQVSDWSTIPPTNHHSTVITVTELNADTTYSYRVEFSDGADDVVPSTLGWRTFRTLPEVDDDATRFEFVFGSCLRPSTPWPLKYQNVFEFIRQELTRVRAVFLLGDLVYSDLPPVSLLHAYDQVWADELGFASLAAWVPTFSMYDDHELRNDYTDGPDTELYAEAMRYYTAYAGTRNPAPLDEGEHYYAFDSGCCSFFVLDTRKYNIGESKLGPQQLQTLLDWLASPDRKRFKFLLSPVAWGSTFSKSPNKEDAWAGYADERDSIFSFIHENSISGVVLLSADLHYTGVVEFDHGLVEVTASPLQHVPLPAWTHDVPGEQLHFEQGFGHFFGHVQVEGDACNITVWRHSLYVGEPHPLVHVQLDGRGRLAGITTPDYS